MKKPNLQAVQQYRRSSRVGVCWVGSKFTWEVEQQRQALYSRFRDQQQSSGWMIEWAGGGRGQGNNVKVHDIMQEFCPLNEWMRAWTAEREREKGLGICSTLHSAAKQYNAGSSSSADVVVRWMDQRRTFYYDYYYYSTKLLTGHGPTSTCPKLQYTLLSSVAEGCVQAKSGLIV